MPVRRIHLSNGEPSFDVYDTAGPVNHDLHHGHYTIHIDEGIPHITPVSDRSPPLTA